MDTSNFHGKMLNKNSSKETIYTREKQDKNYLKILSMKS